VLRKLFNFREKIDRNFSLDSVIEHFCFFGIFLAPLAVSFFPAIIVGEQFLFVLGKVIAHFLRDEIMFVGQAEAFPRGIDKFCAGFAMCFVRSGNFGNAFADESMRDDELWFSVVPLFRNVQRIEKLLHVLAIDFLNVEALSLEAFASIFTLRLLRRRIEGYGVVIVYYASFF